MNGPFVRFPARETTWTAASLAWRTQSVQTDIRMPLLSSPRAPLSEVKGRRHRTWTWLSCSRACRARTESFRFDGYPVEAFVHDRETLEYFFLEVDRPSGVPALPQMVVEGVEIPAASEVSRDLRQLAASVIAAGPPALDAQTEQRMRYFVSDLIDDLRAPRSKDELVGAGARLYEQLADYHLRRQGLWSAKGKAIPRVLQGVDPELSAKYSQSFSALFALGDATEVVRLAEELLRATGGPLFDGYRAEAPATWRKARRDTAV